MWDNWAKTQSPNKNVKVYIGAPAGPQAANPGYYVDVNTLGNIAVQTRNKYSSFGGIMLWDASQAYGELSTPTEEPYILPASLQKPITATMLLSSS